MTSHLVMDETSTGVTDQVGDIVRSSGRSSRQLAYETADSMIGGLWKAWWLTTASLVVVGAVSQFGLVRSDQLGPLFADSEVAAGNEGAASLIDDEFEQLPAVRYGGLDVAFMDARPIPQNNSGQPIIVVDLAVRNTTAQQVRLTAQEIDLLQTDGTATPMVRFEYTEHANRLVLNPGETQQALAVFKLGAVIGVDLDGFSLHIGEEGRWPEILPLDGTVAPAAFPQPLENLNPEAEPTDLGDLSVELADASTVLEYGVYRARVGTHLAVISVLVSGSVDSGPFDQELWSLQDGDDQRQALRATVGQRSAEDGTVAVELVFPYSTEASELELFVGDEAQNEAQSVARFAVQSFE